MNTPILRTALLAAAVASLAACATKNTNTGEANENNPRTEASARLSTSAGGAALPNPQSPTQGTVKFSQVRDTVSVTGSVTGLAPNARHAFHVLADQHVIINAPVQEVLAFDHPFIKHFFLGERGLRAMELLKARRGDNAPAFPPAGAPAPQKGQ